MIDPLSLVKTATEAVKAIQSIMDRSADETAKAKLARAIESLADLQIQVSELKLENQQLRTQIRDTELSGRMEAEVEYRDGAVFLKTPNRNQKAGPFCEACFALNASLSPLRDTVGSFRHIKKYHCAACHLRKQK